MGVAVDMRADNMSSRSGAKDMPNSGPVLVAVDLLPASEKPVLWACEYAQSVRASVCIVHAVHEPVSAPGLYSKSQRSNNLPEPLDVAAGRMMEQLLSEMRGTHSGLSPLHNADTVLVTGLPQNRIVEIVEDKNAQVLVLGHRQRTGLQNLLDGSVAWHVMQKVSVPVVVIS